MPFIVLLAFGLLWMPQDGALTLEQLVEKMEARVAPVRDLSFEVEAEMGGGMLGAMMKATARHEVASRRDGTLRVRSEVDVRKTMMGLGVGGIIPGPTEFVYGEDALYVRREGGGRRESKGLRAAAARFVGNASFEGLGGTMALGQNVLYAYHLSPRRALALDGDVRLVGRRRLAGEEVYLLVAQRSLGSAAPEGSPLAMLTPTAYVKKIYVGATDFLVRRIELRFGGAGAFGNVVYSLTVSERTEIDGVAFPTKVVEQIDSPGMSMVGGMGMGGFTHIAKGFRRGDPGELLEEDLYATAATEPLDQIDKALASEPGDPALLFSKVIAQADVFSSSWLVLVPPGAKKVPDAATQMADLEKIVAKRWAPSPARALMALYAQAGDAPKLMALAERVEKDGKRSPVLALEAAEALNTLGQFDRALTLLELASGAPAVRVAEERLAAYIGKGDLKKAMGAFRGALTAHFAPLAWVEHLAELRDQFPKGIDVEKVVVVLDEALATLPKEPALYLARLRVRSDEDIVRTILECVEEPRVREVAMAVLYEKIKEAKPEEVEKLLTALPDAAFSKDKGSALMVRGVALAKAGKKDEARKAFLEGLATDVHVTSDLVAQMDELKDDEVTERACLAYLKSSKDDKDLVSSLMQQKSGPLPTLGGLYAKQKRYGALYHLLKGNKAIEQMGALFWFAIGGGRQEFPKAAAAEAMKDRSELPGLKWLARSMGGMYGRFMGELPLGVDIVHLLEKAREWAPDDLEVLQGLAESYALNNGQKAIEVASEYLKFLERGVKPPAGGWTCDQATLAIAQAHQAAGNKEEAKGALAKVNFSGAELSAHEIYAAAELLEECDQVGDAVRLLEGLADEGYRLHMRLATLYERAENWEGAVRCYNRSIQFGLDEDLSKDPTQIMAIFKSGLGKKEKQPSAQERKTALFEKIGKTYFIDRLMERPQPPLTADEEEQAKMLFAEMAGDDLEARESAAAELHRMGPKVAKIIRPGLDSGDEEVRARVRAMLTEWAEPK